MPAPELSDRRQWVVYREFAGYDEFGEPVVGDPVELRVRWEPSKAEAQDPQGNTVTLDAKVTLGQDIKVGSVMWLGRLADWPGTDFTVDTEALMRVITFTRTPEPKARFFKRMAGLKRFRDTLPTESTE